MNITKKRLRQIIEEECGAVMADSQGMDDSHLPAPAGNNMTITGSPDHEIQLAYKQLNRAAKYSQSLASRMENMPENNLPAWVQAKITKASDYISMVYHYLEEDLNMEHDADAAISIEKQPINEMFETMMDPESIIAIAGGLYTLWNWLKSNQPNNEEALNKVRQEIEKKVVEADLGTAPRTFPAQDEKQSEEDLLSMRRRKAQLQQMKKDRGISI